MRVCVHMCVCVRTINGNGLSWYVAYLIYLAALTAAAGLTKKLNFNISKKVFNILKRVCETYV